MAGIKKIDMRELRLGMFLHALDGSWLDNPFWKSKFLLTEETDLRKAQASGLRQCWIDTDRGADLPPPPPPPAPPPAPEPVCAEVPLAARAVLAAPAQPLPPTSFHEEMRSAADLCNAAREATMSMFGEARLGNAIDAQQCIPLVNDISDSVLRNPGALISLARLKTSDDYTYMHSVAVCALMVSLGRALHLSEADCREAGLAGLLHDIGKAFIPLDILNKPGKLTDAEFDSVKSHPVRGHELLVQGGAASAAVLDVCLHHHEKVDGSGYPDKLAGEQISLLSRMGAVCDVYDAITSNRPYKAGWDPAESITRMISWKGHFDPKVLSAFIQVVGIYPTGSLVKMRSNRLAVVLEQNSDLFTKPVVKAFFSIRDNVLITPETIDLSVPSAKDSIVGREARGNWDAKLLDGMWAGDLASR